MIERAHWERRFKARIVARLTQPLTDEERAEALARDPDFEPWTQRQAEDAAADEFAAVSFDDLIEGFEEDPEGSADECLSNWEE